MGTGQSREQAIDRERTERLIVGDARELRFGPRAPGSGEDRSIEQHFTILQHEAAHADQINNVLLAVRNFSHAKDILHSELNSSFATPYTVGKIYNHAWTLARGTSGSATRAVMEFRDILEKVADNSDKFRNAATLREVVKQHDPTQVVFRDTETINAAYIDKIKESVTRLEHVSQPWTSKGWRHQYYENSSGALEDPRVAHNASFVVERPPEYQDPSYDEGTAAPSYHPPAYDTLVTATAVEPPSARNYWGGHSAAGQASNAESSVGHQIERPPSRAMRR